jgi:hypothetical protein
VQEEGTTSFMVNDILEKIKDSGTKLLWRGGNLKNIKTA